MGSTSKSPGVGSSVLVRSGDRLLLIRRATKHGHGTWGAPGGFLEFGETPEDCAIRETKEETGVVLDRVRFETFTNDVIEDEDQHNITLWFSAEHPAEPLEPTEEASEIRWFDIDELPEPLYLPLQNLLSKHPM